MFFRLVKKGVILPLLWGVGLTGCVQQPAKLYHWGAYEAQVYARFKNSSGAEVQIQQLEKSLAQIKPGQKAAPGYHAQLGMLYAETGQWDAMTQHFEQEKALFPESAPFISYLQNNAKTKTGAKP